MACGKNAPPVDPTDLYGMSLGEMQYLVLTSDPQRHPSVRLSIAGWIIGSVAAMIRRKRAMESKHSANRKADALDMMLLSNAIMRGNYQSAKGIPERNREVDSTLIHCMITVIQQRNEFSEIVAKATFCESGLVSRDP
jgi:hypothetical protein